MITAIIPAYNAAAFLPAAIASVRAQTYPVAEIIVVDNNSTDDTAAVASAWGARVIAEAVQGIAAARNAGMAAAQTEWVALLDADDTWLPEKLARQVAVLDGWPDVDFIATDYTLVSDGRVMGVHDAELLADRYRHLPREAIGPTSTRVQVRDMERLLSPHLNFFSFLPSSLLLRRAFVLARGGFDVNFALGEELEFYLRVLNGVAAVARVEEPLVQYHLQAQSVSRDLRRLLKYRVAVREKIGAQPALYAPPVQAWARQTLPYYYRFYGRELYRHRDRVGARAAFIRSWRTTPTWQSAAWWVRSWMPF